jgi:hypothetical protein
VFTSLNDHESFYSTSYFGNTIIRTTFAFRHIVPPAPLPFCSFQLGFNSDAVRIQIILWLLRSVENLRDGDPRMT